LHEPSERAGKLASEVIGAGIRVHKTLGPGYKETIYERALAKELERSDIPFDRQFGFDVYYRGKEVGRGTLDFYVGRELVVELKAVRQLTGDHKAQIISYLKGTGTDLGLLMNFSRETLKSGLKRVVRTHDSTMSESELRPEVN